MITGPSGNGKTSLIRAIRWVALGEPAGETFIFTRRDENGEILEQADFAEVGIATADNLITKKRRKGKTAFTLATMAEPLEQAETPPEVTDALGMTVTSFGDFEAALNFAYQLGAPFLISEPASAGAKVLGKLAGTEAVDKAIKAISKDTYAARQDKQQAEKDEAARIIDLQEYADLDDLVAQLEACEYLVTEMDRAAARAAKLKGLVAQSEDARSKLLAAEDRIQALAKVPQLVEDLDAVEARSVRIDRLQGLKNTHRDYVDRVNYYDGELQRLACIEEATTRVAALEVALNRTDKLNNLATLYTQNSQIVKKTEEILAKTKDLDIAAAELETLESRVWRIEIMRSVRGDYKSAMAGIERYTGLLDRLKGIPQAVELMAQVQARADRIAKLKDLAAQYRVKNETARAAERRLTEAVAQETESAAVLAQIWEGLDVCPLCDQPVNKGACC